MASYCFLGGASSSFQNKIYTLHWWSLDLSGKNFAMGYEEIDKRMISKNMVPKSTTSSYVIEVLLTKARICAWLGSSKLDMLW
jgi:hypothetical protein